MKKASTIRTIILTVAAVTCVWRVYAIGCKQFATSGRGGTGPPQCEWWKTTVGDACPFGTETAANTFCNNIEDATSKCDAAKNGNGGAIIYGKVTKTHWKGTAQGGPPATACDMGTTDCVVLDNVPAMGTVICTDPPA